MKASAVLAILLYALGFITLATVGTAFGVVGSTIGAFGLWRLYVSATDLNRVLSEPIEDDELVRKRADEIQAKLRER